MSETSYVDYFGKKIDIGDKVLYLHSASRAGVFICEAEVVELMPKTIKIKYPNKKYSRWAESDDITQCVPADKCIKYDWEAARNEE